MRNVTARAALRRDRVLDTSAPGRSDDRIVPRLLAGLRTGNSAIAAKQTYALIGGRTATGRLETAGQTDSSPKQTLKV